MPTYEYLYTRADGEEITVTKVNVPMSQSSESIEVIDEEDGISYIAERVISLTANMGASWDEDVRNSDLPPKHYGPEDVQRDLDRRKGRKRTKRNATTS